MEALAARERIRAIDKRLEDLLDAHPDGHLVRSLPGMGYGHHAVRIGLPPAAAAGPRAAQLRLGEQRSPPPAPPAAGVY
jgi:hypothetical protein